MERADDFLPQFDRRAQERRRDIEKTRMRNQAFRVAREKAKSQEREEMFRREREAEKIRTEKEVAVERQRKKANKSSCNGGMSNKNEEKPPPPRTKDAYLDATSDTDLQRANDSFAALMSL